MGILFQLNSGRLEAASELRVEGHAEGEADVVLGRASEACNQIVSLEEADRHCLRSSPVITTAKGHCECVVRNRHIRAENVRTHAVMGEAHQAMNKHRTLVASLFELGTEQVGVDVLVSSALALVGAVHVGGDAENRVQAERCHAFPAVLVDSIGPGRG